MGTQRHTIGFISAIVLLTAPVVVSADSVHVVNNVSSSASTGGNSASNGQIIEGTSVQDVVIERIINGEVIERIETHTVDSPEPIIEQTVYTSEDTTVHTEVFVEVSAGTSSSDEFHDEDEVMDSGTEFDTQTVQHVNVVPLNNQPTIETQPVEEERPADVAAVGQTNSNVFVSVKTFITNVFSYVFGIFS